MKVNLKIVCVVLLALCLVAENEGWWGRRSSSSSSSSSSSRSSSSSSRSSSSSSSSSRTTRRGWFRRGESRTRSTTRRGWFRRGESRIRKARTTASPQAPTRCSYRTGLCTKVSENSCPLKKAKKHIPKIIPQTFHQCLEGAPQQCCSVRASLYFSVYENWQKYPPNVQLKSYQPYQVRVAPVKVIDVIKRFNVVIKTARLGEIIVNLIISAVKKNVTKIELVERSIKIANILKKKLNECVPFITQCLQKSHMTTNLRNEPGKVTHSAALLYTDEGGKYLIEKGNTYGTKNDRRQIRFVPLRWSLWKWTNYDTITPRKQRPLYEYYDAMGKGYNLYNDNCHDATKAVERLAEKNT